ncbi:MAG: PHP-associated domain-containing protein [Promethearchaeota archaeon]
MDYHRNRYGALFDGHLHTYFDFHDGRITPLQLVKRTKKLGFNWINAMAHDTIRGVPRIKKIAKEYNLPVIPSMEISTSYNHLLAYGVQEWGYAKDCWDPEIVIERLRAQDCAIFISHPGINPYKGYWTPEIVKRLDVDGIEWINGSNYFFNHRTWKWFKNYPKGKIAGTDAHHITNMGFNFTQVDTNSEDPDDLVSALKKGKCRPRGNNVPIERFLAWNFYILSKRRFFPNYPIEGYQIAPNYGKVGIQPDKEIPIEQWRSALLKKPVLVDF